MKIMQSAPDGGKGSGVTAYFLFESKRFGSVALLRFAKGSREAFHSHAFNALTWWLSGSVTEHHVSGNSIEWRLSFKPKRTGRDCFHKIEARQVTWALTVRGPWVDRWQEKRGDKFVTLTHGRKEVV
jgi:hypothetical protein